MRRRVVAPGLRTLPLRARRRLARLASLHGEVLQAMAVPLRDRSPDVACHQLAELVTAESARVTRPGARLLGIGVGLPGAVDTVNGVIQFAPNLGWHDVEVGHRLARELVAGGLAQVPVYCHNEADLTASARRRSAAGRSTIRWSTSAARWAWARASSSTASCSPAPPVPPARSATPS